MNAHVKIAPVLRVRGLAKSFAGRCAVDRIDFDVASGDIVGFLGPNGAGKTTVMSMIAGLLAPDAGQIDLFGVPGGSAQRQYRARLGFLQEKPCIYPEMTAREYLRFFADLYGVGNKVARIENLLDRIDLSNAADRPLGVFSRGMQQRACLARVLLHEPDFLMLDEPTLGLDPTGVAEMRAIFRELSSQGVTLLFSSHQLAEMERVCDQIILMDKGRIVASGKQRDLLPEAKGNAFLVEIDEPFSDHLHRIEPLPEIETVRLTDSGKALVFPSRRADGQPGMNRAALSRLLTQNGLTVLGVSVQRQTLEELFLRLTDGNATNPLDKESE